MEICNGTASAIPMDVYAIIDVDGMYWYYPTWNSDIDRFSTTVASCECLELTILDFIWPNMPRANQTCRLWAAAITRDDQQLFEDYCMLEFSY
ncbi:hypothetical protein K8T06_06920 [bacterium]|nr:hypothetical protein [bacterium]